VIGLQFPPLTLDNMSLLLAVIAIVLLITTEIISPYYGQLNLIIHKKKLRNVALMVGLLFFVTFFLRVLNIAFGNF
jgi:hypothetical protein